MDIKEAQQLVDSLMSQHLSDTWTFKWDRAIRRFGSCHGGTKTITLSKKLTKLNSVEEVTDTILHEIAHALDYEERGDSNHDENWVRIAKSIGCNGKRCYSNDVIQPQMKWLVSCDTCGRSFQKAKYGLNACGKCCIEHNNGVYAKKFQLKFELNPDY